MKKRFTTKEEIIKSISIRNMSKENDRNLNRLNQNEIPVLKKDIVPNKNTIKQISSKSTSNKVNFILKKEIPKRMFFYWNNTTLSWMRYMTIYSFKKMNPNWDVTLYLSSNKSKTKTWGGAELQDYHNYEGKCYFTELYKLGVKIENVAFPKELEITLKDLSPIHESDLFRYYQLFIGGGFYCDMDVLFFRPLNDFYNKINAEGFDTIIHEYEYLPNEWALTIGFLGSSINNEYFKTLFEFGVNNIHLAKKGYQSMGVELVHEMTGSQKVWNILISRFPTLKFYNLPTELIYDFDCGKVNSCYREQKTVNEFNYDSVGYHWYGGHPTSQKYNNILTHLNYSNHKITFSAISNYVINLKDDEIKVMLAKRPRISIVMSYYNRKMQFHETLKSISRSKFSDFELIVVDDGSDDKQRVEEFLTDFPYLKIIRLEKKNKRYVNSCIPFNIGIRASRGEIIMLQNPECFHVGDILSYADRNVNDSNYITIQTYAIDEETKLLGEYENVSELLNNFPQHEWNSVDKNGWLNHKKYNPTKYHYCSAITRSNMNKLNGFDERYAKGVAKDDDEFIARIERLGLESSIVDDVAVIHQYHECVYYNILKADKLCAINEVLLRTVTKIETAHKANNSINIY